MGDATHVVQWSNRGKPEPSVEVLRRELCSKCYLARSGVVRGVEKKSHHELASALSPCFGDCGNPCHLRLTTLDERERQAARGDGQAPTAASDSWGKGGQGNQAARVVGVRDAEIRDLLLHRKDPPPNLECRKPFVGTDRRYHFDPW